MPERHSWTIAEWGELHGYSRSKAYQIITNGRVRTFKDGGSHRISREADAEYVKQREAETAQQRSAAAC